MDIKTLLLTSLSSKKPICASRRFYTGKLCFIIKYVVKGKLLTIKSIKNPNCKSKTWAERIKHYSKKLKKYHKKNNGIKETLAITKDLNYENKATFTEEITRHTQVIQTEIISEMPPITKSKTTQSEISTLTSSAQQTIASVIYNKKPINSNTVPSLGTNSKTCQTVVVSSESRGIQCKRLCYAKSTNTDDNSRNSSTQSDLFILSNPEKSPLCWRSSDRDFDVVIYMLNEIGEIVINQNQLLSSNSEMIKEIVERMVVDDSKPLKSDSRSISTQTDEPAKCIKSDNSSQTATSLIKSRKLLCLKGKSSHHKKSADMKKS